MAREVLHSSPLWSAFSPDEKRRLEYLMKKGPLYFLMNPESFQGVEAEILQNGVNGLFLRAEYFTLGSRAFLLYHPPAGSIPLSIGDISFRQPEVGKRRALQLLDGLDEARRRLLFPNCQNFDLSALYAGGGYLLFPILPLRARAIPMFGQQLGFWQDWGDFYRMPKALVRTALALDKRGAWEELVAVLKKKETALVEMEAPEAQLFPAYQKRRTPAVLTEMKETADGRKKRGRKALLVDDDIYIGSDPVLSDLIFKDPGIARRHLHLFSKKGAWYAEDLSGNGGSFLDGLRLRQKEVCLLPAFCQIRIVSRLFLFENPSIENEDYFVPKRRSPASPRPGTM